MTQDVADIAAFTYREMARALLIEAAKADRDRRPLMARGLKQKAQCCERAAQAELTDPRPEGLPDPRPEKLP